MEPLCKRKLKQPFCFVCASQTVKTPPGVKWTGKPMTWCQACLIWKLPKGSEVKSGKRISGYRQYYNALKLCRRTATLTFRISHVKLASELRIHLASPLCMEIWKRWESPSSAIEHSRSNNWTSVRPTSTNTFLTTHCDKNYVYYILTVKDLFQVKVISNVGWVFSVWGVKFSSAAESWKCHGNARWLCFCYNTEFQKANTLIKEC